MNTLKEIIKDHFQYRKQLIKLAKADIIKTYKGAALGWAWALVKPTIQIFVFWFAFSFGLRKGEDVAGYPFFLWMIAGFVPWFYMSDMISGGASSLRRYTYLITKIKFPITTIPTFVAMSNFVTHMVLLIILMAVYMMFGYMPDIYYLQLPFYMFLMFMFFVAWGLFAGMLSAISRDFLNLVKSVVTALFWMSGIIYNVADMSNSVLRSILLFNPITILVNGYRNCFVYKQWFWETPNEMRNFVIIYAIMVMLAVWAYKKLRKDIPDVL